MIKSFKSNYKKIICVLMVLILAFGFTLANALNSNASLSDMSTRTIDVNQMTNGEKINVLLDEFNDYETTNTDTTVSFQGDMYASIGEILGFDSLSNQEEAVVKKFNTSYDYETNNFYMNISYYSGDALLETVSAAVEPQYDEVRDDGYIEYEGERFYFSESFGVDGLNECIALVDDTVILGVGLVIVCGILITMAVTPPSVHQEIQRSIAYVTETIVQAVKSFWGWFTRWVTRIFTRTVAKVVSTLVTTYTPTFEISGEKIKTKEISRENRLKLPKTTYYLAFADPTNNKLYLSTVNIKSSVAIAIMASPMVQKCIGNSGYQMLASVFTVYEINAIFIMDKVGYASYTPPYNPHPATSIDYMTHYHSAYERSIRTPGSSNGKMHSPHMFFEIQI